MKISIEKTTEKNTYYRKVLYTTKQLQLVVMCLKKGQEIGREKHPHTSQFIRVEKGKAKAVIGKSVYRLKSGDAVIIPAGKYHNIINTGKKDLKLYTIYSPPEHPKNRKEKLKKD